MTPAAYGVSQRRPGGGAAVAPGPEAARRDEADSHRIFIAVPLSPDVRDAAARARTLLGAYADRFRWVSPSQLHLTLQFLGDITTADVAEAVGAARAAAGTVAPFAITFAGLGGFPSVAAPRVVWVGVTRGAERLAALAGSLARALRDRRFSLDPRPFAPHLTLARARGTGRPPDLRREAEAFDRVVLGDEVVTKLVVVKSVLCSLEPVHTIVATAPLSATSGGSD